MTSDLESQIVVAAIAGMGTLLGAGLTILAGALTERRRMRETALMRNLEDRKRIAAEILEASQSLTEYFNDHWKEIDRLQPEDVDEPKERFRVMTRANRRARIYFSPNTVALIAKELRRWRKMLELVDLPVHERKLARFRAFAAFEKSGTPKEMEAALRREVGVAEEDRPGLLQRWRTFVSSVTKALDLH